MFHPACLTRWSPIDCCKHKHLGPPCNLVTFNYSDSMQQLTGGSKSEVLFVGIVVLSGAGLVLWGFSLEGRRPTIHPPQLAQLHPSRTPSYDNEAKLPNEDNTELPCTKWAIVSLSGPPIPPPPPWPHWCLLVLIDSTMPVSPPLKRVTILDSSWHDSNCTFQLCRTIPWHGEKKRTLGYLFAIQLGATMILDLEPGSFLEVGSGPEKLDEGRVEVKPQTTFRYPSYISCAGHLSIYQGVESLLAHD